jgi:hypothetical protein
MKTGSLTKQKLEQFREAKFLYFDLECYLKNGIFVANYACIQNDDGEQWTFPADPAAIGEKDITNELCEFIFQNKHHGYTVMAHNFKG